MRSSCGKSSGVVCWDLWSSLIRTPASAQHQGPNGKRAMIKAAGDASSLYS